MKGEKNRADSAKPTPKNTLTKKSYQNTKDLSIEQKQIDAREKKLKQSPKVYRNHFIKAYETNSLKEAIVANCLECTAYAKMEITNCTDYACPLYKHRPYQKTPKTSKSGGFSHQNQKLLTN